MTVAEWEKVHSTRTWGTWPNVRFVEWAMRRFGSAPDRAAVQFLELGCGAGAQLRFLWEEGFYADGFDGSKSALDIVNSRFNAGEGQVALQDLAEMPLGDGGFDYDCVFDVCTLQHLGTAAADVIVKARTWLKPGGYIFSIFAADGSQDGSFGSDVPAPTLLMASEIPHLFAGFDLKVGMETVRPVDGGTRQHWIIEGRKR